MEFKSWIIFPLSGQETHEFWNQCPGGLVFSPRKKKQIIRQDFPVRK
jgi:hypothetical protein